VISFSKIVEHMEAITSKADRKEFQVILELCGYRKVKNENDLNAFWAIQPQFLVAQLYFRLLLAKFQPWHFT